MDAPPLSPLEFGYDSDSTLEDPGSPYNSRSDSTLVDPLYKS
jgi:hypothetical protein